MLALFCLHVACSSVGLPGEVCQAVAWTESNVGANVDHPSDALGLCGVRPRYSPLPAWALRTTVGGAVGCGLAVKAMRERYGSEWTSYYVCSRKGVKRGLPSCVRAAEKLRRAIARLRPARNT